MSAEAAAVKSGDLGAWLSAIGLSEVLDAMEDIGAESPHDLMYLEQDDIESLGLQGGPRLTLLSAIGRIEGIEAGNAPAPAPAAPAIEPAPAPAPPPSSAGHEEHGHILHLHREEMDRERQKTAAEASRRSALEQEVAALRSQVADACASTTRAERELNATLERTKRQLDDLASKNRQLEAQAASAPAPSNNAADSAARRAAEAKAERLAAQLREAQAAASSAPSSATGGGSEARPPGTDGGGEPMAVIGIACRFAAADNPAQFWSNLEAGRDCVTVGPRGRWDVDDFFDPDPEAPGKSYSHWGGFLDEIQGFEPAFFGISQRECHSMDPQQRLFLECAWEAMEDAGKPPIPNIPAESLEMACS